MQNLTKTGLFFKSNEIKYYQRKIYKKKKKKIKKQNYFYSGVQYIFTYMINKAGVL
jgi:hypothetical protein